MRLRPLLPEPGGGIVKIARVRAFRDWWVTDSTGYEWPWCTDDPMTGREVVEGANRILADCFSEEAEIPTAARIHPGLPGGWHRLAVA